MKILFLNYEFPPLGGGTGIANEYLLKEFAKRKNLYVDVVTSSVDKYKEKRLAKNIRVFYLNIGKKNKNIHHQKSWDFIKYFIQSSLWVIKNRENYDLIHAFSGLPGGITALLSGKPYIISLRGTEVPGYERRFSWLIRLIKPLIKLSLRKAKAVDANSQYLKNLALKTAPDLKIAVIPNGVDSRIFYPAKKLSSKPVILCNSRSGKRKGVEYLIRAMPEVLKKIPKVKLVLVGEGIEKESLKRLTNKLKLDKQIKFLGQVKHGKLPEIYRKASVFVLPSLSESLSNSLLEALACGLPVVATKVGGNPELMNKKNGILVPATDSQVPAEAIVTAFNQSWPKIKIGKKFSWDKTAEKYFNLYEKTLKKV